MHGTFFGDFPGFPVLVGTLNKELPLEKCVYLLWNFWQPGFLRKD